MGLEGTCPRVRLQMRKRYCSSNESGRRHITKPICEITYAMREAGIKTSVMVLNAGNGVPPEASSGVSVLFGIEERKWKY